MIGTSLGNRVPDLVYGNLQSSCLSLLTATLMCVSRTTLCQNLHLKQEPCVVLIQGLSKPHAGSLGCTDRAFSEESRVLVKEAAYP